jgi:hypothetical protein
MVDCASADVTIICWIFCKSNKKVVTILLKKLLDFKKLLEKFEIFPLNFKFNS